MILHRVDIHPLPRKYEAPTDTTTHTAWFTHETDANKWADDMTKQLPRSERVGPCVWDTP
jgi:hypothetical protein